MQQAHARIDRVEDDYSERRPSEAALQAVAAVEARMDDAAFERHVDATERGRGRRRFERGAERDERGERGSRRGEQREAGYDFERSADAAHDFERPAARVAEDEFDAVPPTDIRTARREREAGSPRRSGRRRERDADRDRAPLSALEVELGVEEALYAPRHRPRRTTGAAASYARGDAPATRRTVQIGGHGAPAASSLRPTPSELRGPRPDRVAGWAVAFGLFLALLAAATAHGAPAHAGADQAPAHVATR